MKTNWESSQIVCFTQYCIVGNTLLNMIYGRLIMEKKKVFVIMPFADDFFESYEMLKERFDDEFEFSNAGDEDNQQNILADIIKPIYDSDIILADLTGLNPNVMYELGIAHSFNKKTIIITRDGLEKLPFDLKQYRTKDYSTHFKKFFELIEYLEQNLRGAIDGSVVFSNPVSDFLDKSKIQPKNLFRTNDYSLEIPDDEKGFLDFIADIEEDAIQMTDDITDISSGLETLNSQITDCAEQINRVNKTGGSGTVAFVRKQSKRAADYISEFNKKLKQHTESMQTLWTKIEKNTLGLLENEYASKEENKDSLIDYIKSMHGLMISIEKSNESVVSMKENFHNILGIERSMNQSVRFLEQDLSTYLDMTGQMIKSIERIIGKSRYVIGDIAF